MENVEYIIRSGPETLRKTDYCYDCEKIINSGEKIYIVGFGTHPSHWGKVHSLCAQHSAHWNLWEKQVSASRDEAIENKYIDYVPSKEKVFSVVVLPKGQYSNKMKYVVADKNGKFVYRTSREERANGVEDFLNNYFPER